MKKKHLVPDWLFKTFLVFAVWVLTLTGVGRLMSGLVHGCVEGRGSREYCFSSSPNAYVIHIGLWLFGTVCMGLVAILSLGFIPSVGKVYRALYRRRLEQQQAEQKSQRASSNRDIRNIR